MNRLQYYRYVRRRKLLLYTAVALSIILLVGGILAADYAMNSMLDLPGQISILTWTQREGDIYTLSFMNCFYDINLTYIKQDMETAAAWAEQKFGAIHEYVVRFSDDKAVSDFQ